MESGELEPRVARLERDALDLRDQVRANAQEAAAARVLAGAADRDVGEMHADIRALRTELRTEIQDVRTELRTEIQDVRTEIQDVRTELRTEIQDVRTELRQFRQATAGSFNAMRSDFVDLRDHVDAGFVAIRGKLDAAAAGQQQIVELIGALIDTRDE